MQSIPKLICSLLLSLCVPPCYAQSSAETVTPEANQTVTDSLVQQTNTNNPSDVPLRCRYSCNSSTATTR